MSILNWMILGIVVLLNIGMIIFKLIVRKHVASLYGLGEINDDGYCRGELIRYK